MGLVRHEEALAAAGILGLAPDQVTFLGYPDFRTLKIWTEHWGDTPPCESMFTHTSVVPYANAFRPGTPYKADEVLADLKAILREFRPTVIFTSHPGDHNPDHLSLYLFTRIALWDLAAELQPKLWPFLVHHPEWPHPAGYNPGLPIAPPERLAGSTNWHVNPVSAAAVETKHRAVLAHVTQLRFGREYLESFMRSNELFGDLPDLDLRADGSAGQHQEVVQPVIASQLTNTERAKFVGIEERSLRLEGDHLVGSLRFSRPIGKTAFASIYLFGYRPDVPFSQMPKLQLKLSDVEYTLLDQSKTLSRPPITVRHTAKELGFSVPLSLLGDPVWLMGSARTYLGSVPLDWIAWRVIRVRD
jgi:LmbE family N-acetylglucosaminyl deacetylase